MTKYILGLSLFFSLNSFAAASDDNEINIAQVGDTLTLYIDQVGYGNKMGLNNFESSSAAMPITGSSLTFNIDQIGNSNLLFGKVTADSSSYTLEWNGDSNVWDWMIGETGSADSSNYLVDITGDSNTMDLDQGSAFSAERLNFDLTVLGSSNVFDVDIETDDVIWNFDVTGSTNNINTLQKDGYYNEINFILDGSGADVDINQISGTCPTGVSTCKGIITLDVDSENATIQINQKDSANDT
tara:strand:+ start:220 stop:945 length:726 start_codon:yes stop_codon:yes gene_type:complete